jgi:hypothetical protein
MKLKILYVLLLIASTILGTLFDGESQKDTHIHFEVPNKIVADYENKVSKK